MAESAGRYCPQCGHEAGLHDRFCRHCAYRLGVPPPGEGRADTERASVPPPVPTTPACGGGGGFLRSFGLGAGACIGVVAALLLLFVGCAVMGRLAGG